MRRQIPQKASQLLPNCTDFSGTWVGSCTNSDGTTNANQKTVIEQFDCSNLQEDGTDIEIGGSNTLTDTSFVDSTSIGLTVSFAWNSSRTMLTGPLSLSFTLPGYGNIAAVGVMSTAIEGGQLHEITQFTGQAAPAGNFPGLISSDCVYTKSP
jgi:hypothetical protein